MQNKLGQVKNSKPFRLADLIVYALLAGVIVLLFTLFIFVSPALPLSKVYADVGNAELFSYDFEKGALDLKDVQGVTVSVTESDESLSLVIAFEGGGSNVVVIEKSGSARVSEANCSLSKDCAHTSPIIDSNGVIVCVPHRLRIYASKEFQPSLG
ncbi:MAG: NusG domain II-containing protein [Clostridia bacterium]|nr:NusG domain II-containing protein [Clostridia bacterium]